MSLKGLNMRTKVKICCIANDAEAQMAASAGADLIGLVGPMPTGPGVLSLEECRPIVAAAPASVVPVLLTSADTGAAIADQISQTGVRAVQIVRHVDPEVHHVLQELVPDCQRLQVIHVEGPEALALIPVYVDLVDAFLLDSGKAGTDELGGTGRTHDWSVSAEFVTRSGKPVYLAGGLTPSNVAEAVRMVQPYGVDLCSGLREGGPFGALNSDKLAAFMTALEEAT